MANNKVKKNKNRKVSALKSLRQGKKRNLINSSRLSSVRTAVKKVKDAILEKKEKEKVLELLKSASSSLHRAVGKNVIKKNSASRKLSRLALSVKKYTDSSAKI